MIDERDSNELVNEVDVNVYLLWKSRCKIYPISLAPSEVDRSVLNVVKELFSCPDQPIIDEEFEINCDLKRV